MDPPEVIWDLLPEVAQGFLREVVCGIGPEVVKDFYLRYL